MKLPCQNFTTSRVTIREIGTKFLLKKLQQLHQHLFSSEILSLINLFPSVSFLYLRKDQDPGPRVLDELKAPVRIPFVIFIEVKILCRIQVFYHPG